MSLYNSYQRMGHDGQYIRPRTSFSGAIKNIIIANVVVFLVMYAFRTERFFLYYFGLVPRLVWSKGYVWQLFTYMFIHGGFAHIFWNMFVLWMFGTELEATWGSREFYKYYFITGTASGLITFLFSLNSGIPVVGASGALYAVLVAFALLYPNRLIYFYFLIPIKAKYFVLIMGVITFISSFSPGTSQVSHLTHLGGLVVGFLYLRRLSIFRKVNIRLPKVRFDNPFKSFVRKTKKSPEPPRDNRYDTDQTLREEVDRLLDKINRQGYQSLTKEEQQTLYLASEYLTGREKKKD
jgi:membrane associated rhomboid family serine protease